MGESFEFLILGAVQGLTEFLPVSSTGHLILVREFFGFSPENGLAVDAVFHLATALAVLIYFRKDILKLIKGTLGAITAKRWNTETTLVAALIAGTLPAVVAGLFFEEAIETVFRGSQVVAIALIAGSFVFLAAEYVYRKIPEKKETTIQKGFLIGLFQMLALIPGMSRSGMVISGGMLLGLSRVEAARFGFLLSFPIILGAGSLKFYELASLGTLSTIGAPLLLGALAALISGILAIHILLVFVRTQPLYVFIVYRLLLAAVILLVY
jgi:undecaprenyl-diphosphatase